MLQLAHLPCPEAKPQTATKHAPTPMPEGASCIYSSMTRLSPQPGAACMAPQQRRHMHAHANCSSRAVRLIHESPLGTHTNTRTHTTLTKRSRARTPPQLPSPCTRSAPAGGCSPAQQLCRHARPYTDTPWPRPGPCLTLYGTTASTAGPDQFPRLLTCSQSTRPRRGSHKHTALREPQCIICCGEAPGSRSTGPVRHFTPTNTLFP